MLRVLLIGDINSVYVTGYASEISRHRGGDLELDILCTFPPKKNAVPGSFRQVYYDKGTEAGARPAWWQKLRRPWFIRKFLGDHRHEYQVIHVMYCVQDLMVVAGSLRKAAPRLILTVFGSDFMQLSSWKHMLMRRVYRSADFVTANNGEALEKIGKTYRLDPHQLRLCRFGFGNLDEIAGLSHLDKAESRRRLGFPDDRIIICIGYNYDPIQQHLPVLQSIAACDALKKMKERLFFVIPMTYGTAPSYRDKLRTSVSALPFDHATIERFLSTQEVAHLRKAADILVQVQKSDSLSASTLEHMFAGNLLITGSWLPYGDLDKAGIYFRRIGRPEDTGMELLHCLENLESEAGKSRGNSEIIYRLNSWNANIGSWMNLYFD